MRRIALHDYVSHIEGLLDDNRLPEAAAHCHFILQQYPRHVDTYRLFGRTLLEQQLYDEAADVFARLLAADPEDLIAHAGMALAFSEHRELDRAIWHMERAFEIDPYNRAVQDELRKLYIARDGDAPPRLALTRGALARLYMRARLYRQARLELAQLVEEQPARWDLQLALADTLYWDERRLEAAELSQQILDDLPFCIKANAIVADVWLQGERMDEAKEHLKRVQELTLLDQTHLDPESTLGRALNNTRIRLPELIQVEVLDEAEPETKEPDEAAEWTDQATTVVVDDEELPDWLLEVGSPDADLTEEPVEEAEGDERMAWLEEVDVTDLGEPEVGAQAAEMAAGPATDEAGELDESSADAVAGVEAAKQGPDEPLQEAQQAPAAEWDDESLMALDELKAYADAEATTNEGLEAPPDWLNELAEGSEAEVADELPDWLYEAVGLDAEREPGADDLTVGSAEGAAPAGEQEQDSDLEADQVEDESGIARGAGYEEALADLADQLAGAGDDLPAWLLEGDDVLDELPTGGEDEAETDHGDRSALDEDANTWLEELSAQLDTLDEGAEPDEASDG